MYNVHKGCRPNLLLALIAAQKAQIKEMKMNESVMILNAFENRLRADLIYNTPCKQIQPLSRICLHGVSSVASLRRERIFVQRIPAAEKRALRFNRIPMSGELTANMSTRAE